MVNPNCGLARRIYNEVVFFPVVQTSVLVTCVALQARNFSELLEPLLEVSELLESKDTDGTTENFAGVERDSAFDDPIFQIQLFTLPEHAYNPLGV